VLSVDAVAVEAVRMDIEVIGDVIVPSPVQVVAAVPCVALVCNLCRGAENPDDHVHT
jgi:hypothetical protein